MFEQSDLEEETNDSHNTCYQNAIRYKEKENAFLKLGRSIIKTFKLSSQSRKSEFRVFSIVHLNIYNF